MKSVILVAVLSLVILISGCSAVTTTATNTVTTTVNSTTTVAVTQTTTAPASTVTVTATVTQTVAPTTTPTPPKPIIDYAQYTVDQLLLQVTPITLPQYVSRDVEVTGIVAMLTISNGNIREIRMGAVNTAGDAILRYHLYAFNLAERGIRVDPTDIKVGDKVKIRGSFLGILAAPPPAGTSLEKLIMTLDGISKAP